MPTVALAVYQRFDGYWWDTDSEGREFKLDSVRYLMWLGSRGPGLGLKIDIRNSRSHWHWHWLPLDIGCLYPWTIRSWWPKAHLWYPPEENLSLIDYEVHWRLHKRQRTIRSLFSSHLCALTNVVRVTHPIDIGEPCRRTHHWRRTSWCHGMQCIGKKRSQCAHNRPKVVSLVYFSLAITQKLILSLSQTC